MAVMLANQHSIGPAVSTRELTKIFLSVLMITGAISFAYAMGGGVATSPATTQSSEAAGAASASAAADAGTAEVRRIYHKGHMTRHQYDEAMEWLYSIQGGAITASMIANADVEPGTKVILIAVSVFSFGGAGLAKLI